MHYQQQHLKPNNISKLSIIVLSIVLLTGIYLIPTLQIEVQGQVRQQQSPPTPGTKPSPSTTPAPPTPGTKPSPSTTPAPSPTPSSTTPAPSPETTTIIQRPTTSSDLDAVAGAAANQTEDGAVNQSAMVMIPQSSMEMMMSNVQNAMTAMDNGNTDDAMIALESLDQELKSAANASGISVETITHE
jgi:hypothetical protein